MIVAEKALQVGIGGIVTGDVRRALAHVPDAPDLHTVILGLGGRPVTQQSLDAETALFEARRCMSCGNCFECDNCFGVCPDNAVIKLGPGDRYEFNDDYCKGCGICVEECPCGAIEMQPEMP